MTPEKVIRRTRFPAFVVALAILVLPGVSVQAATTNIINGTTVSSNSIVIVGSTGPFDALIITNAGVYNAIGTAAVIGNTKSNVVIVTGAGSILNSINEINVGYFGGTFNRLIITNGGAAYTARASFGTFSGDDNSAVVSGAGSVWSNSVTIIVGESGARSRLTISAGGTVAGPGGWIGFGSASNIVIVTDPGSAWRNTGNVFVGGYGSGNQLTISNGGMVSADGYMVVGSSNISTRNVISVFGGSLYATNTAGTSFLDVRRGTLALNSGTVVVNQLYLTNNADSVMNFSVGLLRVGGLTASNGVVFTVGDGSSAATLDLLGGTHRFANGLKLSTNASLIGSGDIIAGSATNFGIIAPGHSAGTLTFSGDLTLSDSSLLNMEIGGTTSNDYDRVWVGGILRIGGLLNVTFTNDYTGNAGDTFDLFNFGSMSGLFSQTNLPTLGAGKEWNTDHLYTQGEITIVPEPGACGLLALGLAALGARRVKSSRLRVKS